jgi:hypothetical protein
MLHLDDGRLLVGGQRRVRISRIIHGVGRHLTVRREVGVTRRLAVRRKVGVTRCLAVRREAGVTRRLAV